MTKLEQLLAKYNYTLPEALIAQAPAHPRDSARLLVFNQTTKKVSDDVFSNLSKYLPKKAVLVFNQTKVIPARLTLLKPTGGKVRILYLGHNEKEIEVLADRGLVPATILFAIATRSKKSRPRQFGPKGLNGDTISFIVIRKEGSHYFLRPDFPMKELFSTFEQYGSTPIPPYIKHSPLSEARLQREYQAVFAKTRGSVAAPTASLHFTPALIKKIKKAGCDVQFVTLHVNLGTFAPLTETHIKKGRLHSEYYELTKSCAAALNSAKAQGRPIIAVGTTVIRTLESAADARGRLEKLTGMTDLFIREGYQFKFINGMITNFHVPRSSLLMLVAALVGRTTLLRLYRHAVKKKYHFFSFGDGMLLL